MEELREIIAKNISDLRKKSGLTQIELAEKLNYSDKAVSKWERGDSVPDVGVLKQIADLFGVRQPAISKHIANIYKSGELDENSTYSILEYMGNDGKQLYTAKAYNLDMILSVGYRVNSIHATRFRQWSNAVLKK